MVRPSLRTRHHRRLFVRTPGGRVVRRTVPRAPGPARCGACRAPLHGIPRRNPAKLRHLPKTARRPQRPFGGVLCSRCLRAKLKLATP